MHLFSLANRWDSKGLWSASSRDVSNSSRERCRQGRGEGSAAGARGARTQLRPEEPGSRGKMQGKREPQWGTVPKTGEGGGTLVRTSMRKCLINLVRWGGIGLGMGQKPNLKKFAYNSSDIRNLEN